MAKIFGDNNGNKIQYLGKYTHLYTFNVCFPRSWRKNLDLQQALFYI